MVVYSLMLDVPFFSVIKTYRSLLAKHNTRKFCNAVSATPSTTTASILSLDQRIPLPSSSKLTSTSPTNPTATLSSNLTLILTSMSRIWSINYSKLCNASLPLYMAATNLMLAASLCSVMKTHLCDPAERETITFSFAVFCRSIHSNLITTVAR